MLLLDEPFSNLDAHLRQKIREDLHEIIKQVKITTVFVTHDSEDAKAISDKVIILSEGKKVKEGNTEEVLARN